MNIVIRMYIFQTAVKWDVGTGGVLSVRSINTKYDGNRLNYVSCCTAVINTILCRYFKKNNQIRNMFNFMSGTNQPCNV